MPNSTAAQPAADERSIIRAIVTVDVDECFYLDGAASLPSPCPDTITLTDISLKPDTVCSGIHTFAAALAPPFDSLDGALTLIKAPVYN